MGQPSRLPGTDAPDQIVCHVDMDCFYAACERLREPALRGEPVVVGMGYEPGTDNGAVATASYEAREFGVESAQAISVALEHLPRKVDAATRDDLDVDAAGFYRPVDMEYYESVASDIKAILHDRADVVREVSIDEAYLDVTGQTTWDEVRSFARETKREIADMVGVTASIGVAPTMSAAKVASDHDKPDGLVVVGPGEVQSFFEPLPVEAVHGVGPVTADTLGDLGIETAGELAAADPVTLEERFGERGRRIYRFARGADERTVEPRGKPKSLSRESAFTEPTADESATHDRIETLATAVAQRASRRNILYQTISIKVVEPPFDVQTRARTLPGPVSDADLVEEVALDLFEEFDDVTVRKLGVRVANLSFSGETQMRLGEWSDAETDGVERSPAEETVRRDHGQNTDESGQRSLEDFT